MTADLLARTLQEFLPAAARGVVVEQGEIIFDLESARHSVSSKDGRCLLHMWSAERNVVREIVNLEPKKDALYLSVRRFGQAKPHKLMICRERDQRTAVGRMTARTQYARRLEKSLARQFSGWTIGKLSTGMDLHRSFSPVYARGLIRQGTRAMAVLGVNSEETPAGVDAALTFALIWLDDCRKRAGGRLTVEGLRLFVPRGRTATLQLRMAHLNQDRAKFQLCEFDETTDSVGERTLELPRALDSRLFPKPDEAAIRTYFAEAIQKIGAHVPHADVIPLKPDEIAFRLHGLEFARARGTTQPGSPPSAPEIIFGLAGFEAPLTPENEAAFVQFAREIAEGRRSGADRRDRLSRIYPERWLESLIVKDVTAIDSQLDFANVYSQVPAFSASDRSLIDVLTCTRAGRLAVLELKADEDIHLPLQGLDYWARVQWHHARGDFQQSGYFTGVRLSSAPPLLYLVAPSLRVHPAVETILGYLSPVIEWRLAGIDERWREGVKVVFRKQADRARSED